MTWPTILILAILAAAMLVVVVNFLLAYYGHASKAQEPKGGRPHR